MNIRMFLLSALLLGSFGAPAQTNLSKGTEKALSKLVKAEQALSHLYVDTVDESRLVEDAIRGMIGQLDPHSSYTTSKETKALNEPLQGNFEGIGVQFSMVEDTLVVIQPTSGGPSEKVGIVAGDRIVSVNDTTIAGVKMARADIMARLRGKKGSKVKLGIVRRGAEGKLYFVVTRDKIPLRTVTAAYLIRPHVGYIRLESFGLTSPREVDEAIDRLHAQGMRDLILDLQDNGGGYLESAVRITNNFLEPGDLIVYTQGRAVHRQEYRAHGAGKMRSGRLVVLVNEFSASAAEIVSGAIQDQDRGTIVGRRSFGKGLVQRPYMFDDGSMMRITVAHYYTPSGRCIQKTYKKGDLKDYEMDLNNRYQHGEFTQRDSIHFADSLKYSTLRQHRTVYGGGGIMPDEFVPLDTLQYTKYHRALTIGGIVFDADLHYIDSYRKELKHRYATFEQFRDGYEVPQSLLDDIFVRGEKKNIRPKDEDERTRTLPYLKLQLKALIARDLWDTNEYFQIMNEQNYSVRRAVEVITH